MNHPRHHKWYKPSPNGSCLWHWVSTLSFLGTLPCRTPNCSEVHMFFWSGIAMAVPWPWTQLVISTSVTLCQSMIGNWTSPNNGGFKRKIINHLSLSLSRHCYLGVRLPCLITVVVPITKSITLSLNHLKLTNWIVPVTCLFGLHIPFTVICFAWIPIPTWWDACFCMRPCTYPVPASL